MLIILTGGLKLKFDSFGRIFGLYPPVYLTSVFSIVELIDFKSDTLVTVVEAVVVKVLFFLIIALTRLWDLFSFPCSRRAV